MLVHPIIFERGYYCPIIHEAPYTWEGFVMCASDKESSLGAMSYP